MYLAKKRATGEYVAVKYINVADDWYKLKTVYREAKILKELSKMEGSKYISKFRDIYWQQSENHVILILDYVDGQNLASFLKKA